MKSYKNDFVIHTNFLTTTAISLFYCCGKVFTLMNIWMIRKSSVNHHSLPEKDFYSDLKMKDILAADYTHAKRVFKDFERKNLAEYQDLHVQSNTLLLTDVFENFRSMRLKIYESDPTRFLTVPGLA